MKLTVIIPTKFDRGYLKHAINSVRNQTYSNVELLICKGGNVAENINKGIELAKGDLITYIADDDLMSSKSAQLAVDNIGDNDFIHANAVRFVNQFEMSEAVPKVTHPTLEDLITHNHIHGGTVWYKRDLIKSIRFDTNLWTGEEYELHLRMLSNGAKLGYMNDVNFFYRLHPKQKSIGNMNEEYQLKRRIEIERIKSLYR